MKRLSKRLYKLMSASGKTLATAESCTAGGIANAIVQTPGASAYFKGGIVSYTNEVKTRLLSVDAQVLEEQTAVCEEVARQMVAGACKALQADYAIAATGLAGPGGGSREIPVGTIWLACGSREKTIVRKLTGDLGRDKNLTNAIRSALQLFIDFIARETAE